MKNLKFVFISLAFASLMCSMNVYSQSEIDQQSKVKIGVGIDIEFTDFDLYTLPPTNLILSMDLFNVFRIEPGFGFNYKEEFEENSLDEKSKQYRISLGTYWLINFNKTSTYLGIKFDNVKTKSEFYHIEPGANNSQNQFRIGPLVGLEYRFVNKFSIGGELVLLHIKTKFHYADNNNSFESNTKGWKTANSLKFRFYF